MILFNGSTGSLGGAMLDAAGETLVDVRGSAGTSPATPQAPRPVLSLRSRLEDREGLARELAGIAAAHPLPWGARICLLQMAAMTSVPVCEREPERAHRTNVVDTAATVRDVVAWAAARGLSPSVVYVSTCHVYAAKPPGSRLREDDPVATRSVYAATKARAEEALAALARELGVPLVVARVFGLVAPRQPAHFLLPGLLGRARRLDLAAVPGASYARDYLDARDVCRSLLALAQGDRMPAIVNVCSGEGILIRAMLEAVLRLVYPGQAAELCARIGEAPGRPDDIPWIVGDPTTLTRATGDHARRIDLARTIADALAIA